MREAGEVDEVEVEEVVRFPAEKRWSSSNRNEELQKQERELREAAKAPTPPKTLECPPA